MGPTALLLSLLLQATTSGAAAPPSPAPDETVILFLIDNSASLPPLDPDEKRVEALEKMFTFLQGQRYRLVLFGGRREVFVDDVSRYRNNGQWTDFYFAFAKAQELTKGYPSGTRFRIIFLTDAVADPGPEDWTDMGVPPGEDLKAYTNSKMLELVEQMQIPVYVILVGTPPEDGAQPQNKEQAPGFILDLVRAANGRAASPLAQTLASFFQDDGILLRKFVYRVAPNEGLKTVEPIVRRIAAPPDPKIEKRILLYFVLPLTLLLFVLLGLFVRSFPGPGDLEIIELATGIPAHVTADRIHKLEHGGFSRTGLSLVGDARSAQATFTHQVPPLDLSGSGLDTSSADPTTLYLLPLGLDDLRRSLEAYAEDGSKEEKIWALNLDYMAKNLTAAEVERVLGATGSDRRRIAAIDLLRAKAHLLGNDALRRKLTDPRVIMVTYGKDSIRKELSSGALIRVGRYGFLVRDVTRGGRKDARLVLYYDRVPSLLGLKAVLPDWFQRIFRFRRSSQRVVSS